MSCGSSCPCHFKWLADTQGSKRDPINSEKVWLDYAVRLLSREVVGKGKGQETVWSERCKPHWWDKVIALPWKNPTANPKDTKEVLLTKYTALERKLREEGRFPQELEEEAKLWNEGKYRELFLQTSLASLLGKVTGVHTAVVDALEKVSELRAQVNLSLVSDLQQCLSSTLQAINNLSNSSCNNIKHTKRSNPEFEISDSSFNKRKKVERPILPLDKSAASLTEPVSFKSSQEISLQPEISANRKYQTRTNSAKRYRHKASPKLHNLPHTEQTLITTATNITDPLHQAISINGHKILQGDLNHLLLGNVVVSADSALNATLPLISKPTFSSTPTLLSNFILSSSSTLSNTFTLTNNTQTKNPFKEISLNPKSLQHSSAHGEFNPTLDRQSQNTGIIFGTHSANSHNTYTMSQDIYNSNMPDVDFLLNGTEINPNSSNIIPDFAQNSLNSSDNDHSQLCDGSGAEVGNTPSPVDYHSRSSSARVDSVGITSDSEIDHNVYDTDYSTEQSVLEYSTEHSTQGYTTEHSMLDLDDIYSPHEQEQLWKEDGSYLLERFLEDLDESVLDGSAHSNCKKQQH